MYWEEIYYSFIVLRDQFYRCKTQKELDKYSKIEFYIKKYKTFSRFYNDCEDYFSRFYYWREIEETTQDIFYKLLELSQKKILKKVCIWF